MSVDPIILVLGVIIGMAFGIPIMVALTVVVIRCAWRRLEKWMDEV